MTRIRSSLLLLALTACPAHAPVEPPASSEPAPSGSSLDDPLPVDPGVRIGKLANGLTWYVEVNREPAQRAVLRLAVDAGSVLEDDDQRGLAHFVEHMAFNGTRSFEGNALIDYLESIGTRFGAHLNAHTSLDETVYKLQVPTDDLALLDKGLSVLRDWADGITFDPAEIDKERGVVLEEWRRSRGAGGRVRDATWPLTFHGSPYAERLTIGTQESLEGFEPDALVRYYRDWYRPELMAVIAVGDFDPDHVVAQIEELFGSMTGPASPRERVEPDVPDHDATLVAVVADPEITRSSVQVLFKGDDPQGSTHRDYRDNLLDGMVSRMLGERLADLARKPDAPFLGASAGKTRLTPHDGAWSLSASAEDGKTLPALQALFDEAERVRRFGFTEAELERARRNTVQWMEAAWQERDKTDSVSHATELQRVFLTGESMPGIDYEWELTRTWIPAVSLDEMNARARDLFPAKSRTVTVLSPARAGLAVPTETEVLATVDAAAGRELEPPQAEVIDRPLLAQLPEAGEVVEVDAIPTLGITTWKLANGARVLVKPTDFKADEVRFSGWSPGGSSLASNADYVAAVTATSILSRSGVGQLDASQIRKVLAGKTASVSPWIGTDFEGMSGSTTPDDLETALQLTYALFTEPRFDAEMFDLERKARATSLENRLANPNAVFSDAYTLQTWGEHPRHKPWTVARLDEMSLERSRAVYKDRFRNAGDFTWLFVGNVELETLKPLVERYLGSLPGSDAAESALDDKARPKKGVRKQTVRAGAEPKATVLIEFGGPFSGSWAERNVFSALTEALQTRMREVVREELGGTYSAGAWGDIRWFPVDAYTVTVRFECDPERVEELTRAAWGVIDEVRTKPLADRYVTNIQQKWHRGREEALRTNDFWSSALVSALQHGENPLDILGYDDRVDQLSPAAVLAAGKQYLDKRNYLELVLLPEQP